MVGSVPVSIYAVVWVVSGEVGLGTHGMCWAFVLGHMRKTRLKSGQYVAQT